MSDFVATKAYLDNAATTRIDRRVVDAMLPYMDSIYGNPSSLHWFGRAAFAAVDAARAEIATRLGASPSEIYFTSGGTESDNWALRGLASARKAEGRHIITTAIEHPAVLNACRALESEGFEITALHSGPDGRIEPDSLRAAIRPDTILVSAMFANNETGVIQPISEIGRICRSKGIVFHTDAVQAAGTERIDARELCVDALSLSAHKFCGPKGVGLLYVRDGVGIAPLMRGGSQERNLRPGTTNVPGIVGMAKALRLAVDERERNVANIRKCRDRFVSRVLSEIPNCALNGSSEHRLCGNANIAFRHVEGEAVMMRLDLRGIAVSTGSACAAGNAEKSYVIRDLGGMPGDENSSVRFSFGKDNTVEDADYAADALKEEIKILRDWSPLSQE